MASLSGDQAHRFAAARLRAASKYPYLASALFAAPIVTDERVPGVAADRHWRLYVHPDVIEGWSPPQLGAVLVHHCGHLLRDHAERADELAIGDETFADWVTASDCEINDDLDLSERDLPRAPIQPQDIGCAPGRMAEEYFEVLRMRDETRAPDD